MKKRMWAFALALSVAAGAGAGEMKFDRMSITRAPKVKITEGRWHMQGGVALTLFSRNPDEKPLDIQASEIVFEWQPGEQPQKVDLKGNVSVDGEIGTISSQTALLDMTADTLIFTEKVNINSEAFQGISASRFIYHLGTAPLRWTTWSRPTPSRWRTWVARAKPRIPCCLPWPT